MIFHFNSCMWTVHISSLLIFSLQYHIQHTHHLLGTLTLSILRHKNAENVKSLSNPAMLVFIGKLLPSPIRWVPICQGFHHFSTSWEQGYSFRSTDVRLHLPPIHYHFTHAHMPQTRSSAILGQCNLEWVVISWVGLEFHSKWGVASWIPWDGDFTFYLPGFILHNVISYIGPIQHCLHF